MHEGGRGIGGRCMWEVGGVGGRCMRGVEVLEVGA